MQESVSGGRKGKIDEPVYLTIISVRLKTSVEHCLDIFPQNKAKSYLQDMAKS